MSVKWVYIFFTDDNECLAENGGCEQKCVNEVGTYSCACGELFSLANDKRSCTG